MQMEHEVVVGVLFNVLEYRAPEYLFGSNSMTAFVALSGSQVFPDEFDEGRILIDDPADLLEKLSSRVIGCGNRKRQLGLMFLAHFGGCPFR